MPNKVKAVNYPLQTVNKLLHDRMQSMLRVIKPITAEVIEIDDSVTVIIDKPDNRFME